MGATRVTVAVVNPANPSRRWEGWFLVDPGVVDCRVPANRLRAIGIEAQCRRRRRSADGSEAVLEAGVAAIEFMGEVVGATVIFDADDAEPLLGTTALESAGIDVDPQSQGLRRRPAVRLKGLGEATESPRRGWRQIELSNVFVSVALFGVTALTLKVFLTARAASGPPAGMATVACVPAFAILVGAAIGALFGQATKGAMLGWICFVSIGIVAMAYAMLF